MVLFNVQVPTLNCAFKVIYVYVYYSLAHLKPQYLSLFDKYMARVIFILKGITVYWYNPFDVTKF